MSTDEMDRGADWSSINSQGKGACPDEARILCLPEEVWQNIALNLPATDVLSLLCVNRRLCMGLGQSASIWRMLSNRDGTSCYEECKKTTQSQTQQKLCHGSEDKSDWQTEKYLYLFRSHKTDPSKSGGGVHWYPVRPYGQFPGISDREGHLSCVLSRHAILDSKVDSMLLSATENKRQYAMPRDRIVVITGGFSDDNSVCEFPCAVSWFH